MSALTPEDFRSIVAEASRLLEGIQAAYPAIYEDGYRSPRGSDGPKVATSAPNPDGTPRGAGGVLLARGPVRSKLETACRDLSRARDCLKGAGMSIAEAITLIDGPARSAEPTIDVGVMPRRDYRQLTKIRNRRRSAVATGSGALPWTAQDEMP